MKVKELIPLIDGSPLTMVKGKEKRYIRHNVGIEDYVEYVIKTVRAGYFCICIEVEDEDET